MAPDVWQVTLVVTNKSLEKLRGEIGDKAKLLKYNTAEYKENQCQRTISG